MKTNVEIIETKEYVLIKTTDGEYHFSLDEYSRLDKETAIEYALTEISEKNKSGQYTSRTINFEQARSLGFCDYGIKDFIKRIGGNISEEYTILELNKMLTLEALEEYPSECIKLFGKDCIKYLGTVKELINVDNTSLFLREEFLSPRKLHQLAVKFAYSCLDKFESKYPNDGRPRAAIEVKEEWIAEKIVLGDF